MTVPLLHLSTPAIYFKGEGSPRQRKIEKKIAKKKRLYIRIYNFYHSYNNPTAIKQYINEGLYMMEIFLINNLTQKNFNGHIQFSQIRTDCSEIAVKAA